MTKCKIKNVYIFANGMTMVFGHDGQQMPEYQGRTEDVMPLIREAGYREMVPLVEWGGVRSTYPATPAEQSSDNESPAQSPGRGDHR